MYANTHTDLSLNEMKPILALLNVYPAAQSSFGNQQQHLGAYVFNHLISTSTVPLWSLAAFHWKKAI